MTFELVDSAYFRDEVRGRPRAGLPDFQNRQPFGLLACICITGEVTRALWTFCAPPT